MPRKVLVKSSLILEESRYSRVLDEGRAAPGVHAMAKTSKLVGYHLYTKTLTP